MLRICPSEIINTDIELVQTNQENPNEDVSVQNSGPNLNDRAL